MEVLGSTRKIEGVNSGSEFLRLETMVSLQNGVLGGGRRGCREGDSADETQVGTAC